MFWSKERVEAWYNAIFPTCSEVCQNLICLAPHVHAYWERAYFALKPIRISDDKKRLVIQFFWLSSASRISRVNIPDAPLLSAPVHGPNSTRLFNNETYAVIKPGDEIVLETDDAVSRPLPDFRLLGMQWFLHRVTAMSGAAESQNDFHDEDSDDNIMTARQDQLDMYTEGDWDMELEGRFPALSFGTHGFGHMVTLRSRGFEEDYEGEGCEGDEWGSQ
jgi:hypothetical protein